MVIGGAAEGGKRNKQIDHENRGTKEHTVVNDDQCLGTKIGFALRSLHLRAGTTPISPIPALTIIGKYRRA